MLPVSLWTQDTNSVMITPIFRCGYTQLPGVLGMATPPFRYSRYGYAPLPEEFRWKLRTLNCYHMAAYSGAAETLVLVALGAPLGTRFRVPVLTLCSSRAQPLLEPRGVLAHQPRNRWEHVSMDSMGPSCNRFVVVLTRCLRVFPYHISNDHLHSTSISVSDTFGSLKEEKQGTGDCRIRTWRCGSEMAWGSGTRCWRSDIWGPNDAGASVLYRLCLQPERVTIARRSPAPRTKPTNRARARAEHAQPYRVSGRSSHLATPPATTTAPTLPSRPQQPLLFEPPVYVCTILKCRIFSPIMSVKSVPSFTTPDAKFEAAALGPRRSIMCAPTP